MKSFANTMAEPNRFLLILLLISFSTFAMAAYNVVDFGARPDGLTDSANGFLRAWAKACSSGRPAIIHVPQGRFFVSQATFLGPCKNPAIRILIKGTIVASRGYGTSLKWLYFKNVNNVAVYGGILDGRGQALWDCKKAGRSCPTGAISLTIANSKNVMISGLTSWNSELVHLSIQGSSGVTIRNSRMIAPKDSPNTDGVHVMTSSGVTITGSVMKTGDDCISMKPGVSNVLIDHISCGPGHGISIGSLGDSANEPGVQNITVRSVVFTATQNGFRIKTWGKPSTGFVKGVSFQNAVMNNVENPIIVDQNYCPGNINCPNQHSGIKISGVSFTNIRGSSATKVAIKFDCSMKNPCTGMGLKNIKLTYGKMQAQSFCRNARGRTSGTVIPPSCF